MHYPGDSRPNTQQELLLRAALSKDRRIRRALGPSAVAQLPGARQPVFHRMARFVQPAPAYVPEPGADRDGVPELIAEFLSGD